MNLENVTVEMRPRSEWEAADLGVRMIRRDAAAIYRVWFAITVPMLSVALLMVVYSPYPALAALFYWWLEPVADGPILRIISRRLFGEDADVAAALRSIPHLVRRNWIFLLPPYRFHFARSIAMPVTQLEGLQGQARRSRAKVLNLKILNYGIGVTVAYQHLLLALYFGAILIGFVLVPTAYQDTVGLDWMGQFWTEESRTSAALSLLIVYVAQTALEPWFVGAGFGLYINCRTQLEAWDIEVAFRRMVQRRAKCAVSAALTLLMLAVPAALLPAGNVAAAPRDGQQDARGVADPLIARDWSDDEVRPALDKVVASDALKTTREVEVWQAIEANDDVRDGDSALWKWWINRMEEFAHVLSFIVEFGLWILVAVLAGLVFATRKRWLPYLVRRPRLARKVTRISLAGGELSAEELPDDIPAEVLRLWRRGAKRQALSLLYRGSVFAAVSQHGVRLPPSATEGVCLREVNEQGNAEQSSYFSRVVAAWMQCAYAFREPGDDTLLPLCQEWLQHYGDAA